MKLTICHSEKMHITYITLVGFLTIANLQLHGHCFLIIVCSLKKIIISSFDAYLHVTEANENRVQFPT